MLTRGVPFRLRGEGWSSNGRKWVTETSGERKAEKGKADTGKKGDKRLKVGIKLKTAENGEAGGRRKSLERESRKKERTETDKEGR